MMRTPDFISMLKMVLATLQVSVLLFLSLTQLNPLSVAFYTLIPQTSTASVFQFRPRH